METVEQQIQRVGATKAPRITPEQIAAQIISETYVNPRLDGTMKVEAPNYSITKTALACLTICVLVLRNGFTVVGTSACASPENFNAEIGNRIARENAVQQIWAMEGYHLRKKLAQTSDPAAAGEPDGV